MLTDTHAGFCFVRLIDFSMPKIHATSRAVPFSSGEREQYIHCAAVVRVDRTAAGSEIKTSRERRFIYNS